jgi:hypothetical protein
MSPSLAGFFERVIETLTAFALPLAASNDDAAATLGAVGDAL